jgi:hypothetical protein
VSRTHLLSHLVGRQILHITRPGLICQSLSTRLIPRLSDAPISLYTSVSERTVAAKSQPRSPTVVLSLTLTVRRSIASATTQRLVTCKSTHRQKTTELTTPPPNPPDKDTKLCTLCTEPDHTRPLHPPHMIRLHPRRKTTATSALPLAYWGR